MSKLGKKLINILEIWIKYSFVMFVVTLLVALLVWLKVIIFTENFMLAIVMMQVVVIVTSALVVDKKLRR